MIVLDVVRNSSRVRALGSRHCFNTIADSKATLLSTARLNKILNIDTVNKTITVEAGIRYGDFCEPLHQAGFAIHNLASLPHISVAGACATATHGSGVSNGNLATNIVAMDILTADGSFISVSREKDAAIFDAMVVGLGCFGVVTTMTLSLVPTFDVQQDVFLNLPMNNLAANFSEIMSSGYSVSLFTDWQTDAINQVWIKRITSQDAAKPAADFFGATPATTNVHPIIDMSAENCTQQMRVPGPWFQRLPHFKMGFMPSSGRELQAEYFVPMSSAVDAIRALTQLREEIRPFILISEIRSIASDNLWMSMCFGQPSIAIHFTLRQDIEGVSKLLPKIEAKLAPFGVRPHWGKLFTITPEELESRYPKMREFRELVTKADPEGKFRNEFIDRNIFGVMA